MVKKSSINKKQHDFLNPHRFKTNFYSGYFFFQIIFITHIMTSNYEYFIIFILNIGLHIPKYVGYFPSLYTPKRYKSEEEGLHENIYM